MKTFFKLLTVLIGFTLIAPEAFARSRGGGGGGGGSVRGNSPKRSAPAKRSPMTSSRVQRPSSRPAPKQVSRPAPKPASRPAPKPASKPSTRPSQKPSVSRPAAKPSQKPSVNRPTTKPSQKPSVNRPSTLPSQRPGGGPSTKPSIDRPNTGNRPATLPGMVTYPNKPGTGNRPSTLPANRPGAGNRPGSGDGIANRPGGGNANRPGTGNRPGAGNRPGNGSLPGIGNRPGSGDRGGIGNNRGNNIGNRTNIRNRQNNVHIDKVNVNRRNTGLNRPSNLPERNRNWNRNSWGGNRGVWGNNTNININRNFYNNNNFAYRPNYWGARPWWGAGSYHGWHHGHWNYGWNSRYYGNRWYYNDSSFASGFMWGITVWSLGNMVYNMGYNTYHNPYPAPAVVYYPAPSSSGDAKSSISYNEPLSVTAAAVPPGDEQQVELAETKSAEALEKSRTEFKQGDYMAAMKSVDEAIAYTPGDVTLHEYRALVFFALGRYSDAAGVINPVLASGPGWGWSTMVEFYDSSSTYDAQLRKLEGYVKGSPDKADGHFLLGYHYLVCGNLENAYEQFARTTELQPADSIARQLRDLTKSSLPDGGETGSAPEVTAPPPIPSEQLIGTWVSDRGQEGKITFDMKEDGNFTWVYVKGDQTSEIKGTYGLDEQGLLVLSMDDSQMISVVSMPDENDMKFTVVGSPEGDPGLDFKKG